MEYINPKDVAPWALKRQVIGSGPANWDEVLKLIDHLVYREGVWDNFQQELEGVLMEAYVKAFNDNLSISIDELKPILDWAKTKAMAREAKEYKIPMVVNEGEKPVIADRLKTKDFRKKYRDILKKHKCLEFVLDEPFLELSYLQQVALFKDAHGIASAVEKNTACKARQRLADMANAELDAAARPNPKKGETLPDLTEEGEPGGFGREYAGSRKVMTNLDFRSMTEYHNGFD